jgi:iron complex outermembrane receptor protein
VPGVNGASVLTQGSQSLRPERLLSFELGYRGEAARYGLSWDVAAYWNVVSDLIVLSAVTPLAAPESYDPTSQSFLLGRSVFINDPATYNAVGGEIGVTWGFIKGLDVRASTALQRISPTTTIAVCGPCLQAPVAKFNLGAVYRTPVNIDVSADLSYVSGTTWVEREPSSTDATQIVNIQNPLAGYTVINARLAYRFLNDRVSIALVGTQLGPDHQEHPFGNLISRRIFAQLAVTP